MPGKVFSGLGLHLSADGFRGVYATVAAFMWMATGWFSPEYFTHYRNRNRYYFFNLMTLGATLGVFLSDDLYTTLIFFEIMSLTSYVWVAPGGNAWRAPRWRYLPGSGHYWRPDHAHGPVPAVSSAGHAVLCGHEGSRRDPHGSLRAYGGGMADPGGLCGQGGPVPPAHLVAQGAPGGPGPGPVRC